MQKKYTSKLGTAIEELAPALGIKTVNAFWKASGVEANRARWFERIQNKRETKTVDIETLIKGLEDNEYILSKPQRDLLYQTVLPAGLNHENAKEKLGRLLSEPDFKAIVKRDTFSRAELEDFIIDKWQNPSLRIRAYSLYLSLKFTIPASFADLFVDPDNGVRVAALFSVIESDVSIDLETLKKLIVEPPADVAKVAVSVAEFLIEKKIADVSILTLAANFADPVSKYVWPPRLRAVRAIIKFNPPNTLELLSHFKKTTYSVTIAEMREYFLKQKAANKLDEAALHKALEILEAIKNNPHTTVISRKNIETTVKKLTSSTE